jgi:anthranilate phosphoribosyltransferase
MNLGNERTVCVHGSDGLDEITLSGPSTLIIAENGTLREISVTPEEFGLPTVATHEFAVDGPEASAQLIRTVFAGGNDRAASIVLANASVALWTAGATSTWVEGVDRARRALASGDVLRTLEAWAAASQG